MARVFVCYISKGEFWNFEESLLKGKTCFFLIIEDQDKCLSLSK